MRDRVRDHALDDDRCRFYGADQTGSLAEPHRRVVRITFQEGLPVLCAFYSSVACRLVFMAVSAVGEGVALDSRGELRGP